MIGQGFRGSPSSKRPFSFTTSNQHEVMIALFAPTSMRYLLRIVESGNDWGGRKSQGRMIKSLLIRLENCLRTVAVPGSSSVDSSKDCKSMRRDEKADEAESLLMWFKIAERCVAGHMSKTSETDQPGRKFKSMSDRPLIPD
jgi:hypothetical protein